MWILLLGVWLSVFSSFQAEAVTCVGDDVSHICDLPIVKGGRCSKQHYYRLYCQKSTGGCKDKCFGDTPAGHWFDISRLSADGKLQPRWRCRCGCFGQETLFRSTQDISGADIIAAKGETFNISSLDNIDNLTTTYRPINGITYGAEKEKAIKVTTQKGRVIVLSRAHPAVIADEYGKIVAIRKAETLQINDLLLGVDGRSDRIAKIDEISYQQEMVNFNIRSNDATNHLLIANDLVMGDQAWQERLSSVEARIMYRNEILKALAGGSDG